MGHCYDFAVEIVEGCDHAMTVSDAGGLCECPTCGARCGGRFEACGQILEQPGYAPATAPQWAIDRSAPPQGRHPAQSPRRTSQANAQLIDLVELADNAPTMVGDDARDPNAALQRTASAARAGVHDDPEAKTTPGADARPDWDGSDLRSQFEAVADELRQALESATKQQLAAVEGLIDTIDQLVEAAEADRRTLHSVIEGLDRVARRIAKFDRGS